MRADSRCSDRVVVLRWKANFVHGPCEDITEALCTSSELQCNAIGWSAYEIVTAAQLSVGHSENKLLHGCCRTSCSARVTLPPGDIGVWFGLVGSCQRCRMPISPWTRGDFAAVRRRIHCDTVRRPEVVPPQVLLGFFIAFESHR
jgi:hypothetical protein